MSLGVASWRVCQVDGLFVVESVEKFYGNEYMCSLRRYCTKYIKISMNVVNTNIIKYLSMLSIHLLETHMKFLCFANVTLETCTL